MSQPVKLSDALVLEARIVGGTMQRSIAGQVEFWARIGKSLDELMTGRQITAVGRAAGDASALHRLDTVDTAEGRERVKAYLSSQPFPHYFAHPDDKTLLIREEASGQRTVGRFVDRQFVAVTPRRKAKVA